MVLNNCLSLLGELSSIESKIKEIEKILEDTNQKEHFEKVMSLYLERNYFPK